MLTVLVTGIGGNVGQGVARNVKRSFPEIRIIGCNTVLMTVGNHLVDECVQVPLGTDPNYLDRIKQIVRDHAVNLIIPSTDSEMYELSQVREDFPTLIASSGLLANEIYMDKWESYKFHQAHGIAFAESWLPSKFNFSPGEYIAKPRKGRGSRGLVFDTSKFPDLNDEYLIQSKISGIEITTAVYVSFIDRQIKGIITFQRQLENGTTSRCEVIEEFNTELLKIANAIVSNTDIKGSFNIQSIVHENTGEIVPFEINCRISGTNSLRSLLGFEDVKYTVEELLNNVMCKPFIVNSSGGAFRFLSDIVYFSPFDELKGNNSDIFCKF